MLSFSLMLLALERRFARSLGGFWVPIQLASLTPKGKPRASRACAGKYLKYNPETLRLFRVKCAARAAPAI